MRLNNINSTSDDQFLASLRILLNGVQSSTISEQIIRAKQKPATKSIQQIFVESAIRSRLLSEEDMTGIQALLQAGIAKIKSAITPGSSKDLDVLMSFMAPGTGGSPAVQELIAAAKAVNGPISQNDDWWTNFFSTMNIDDRNIQKDIQYQVADELGQEMLRDPGLPSPEPSVAPEQPRTASNRSNLDSLKREREDAQTWSGELQNLISKRREDQARASQHVNSLNSRLDQLMARVPRENVYAIGDMILEFDSVKKHLRQITNLTIKNINNNYGTNIGTISEAGLMDKLRTMMANPKYAKRSLNKETSSANNTQGAKLAIQLAIQHMRKLFQIKLSNAGLSPNDIMKTYSSWSQLKKSGGDPNQIAVLEKKLADAFKLFDLKPSGETGEIGSGIGEGDGIDPMNADKVVEPSSQQLGIDGPQAQPQVAGNLGAPQPAAGVSSDLGGFKKLVAQKIYQAAQAAAVSGGNYQQIIAAGKNIARKAYRVNPQLAQEVWNLFVYWFRSQARAQASRSQPQAT